jgi:hypothetical protein
MILHLALTPLLALGRERPGDEDPAGAIGSEVITSAISLLAVTGELGEEDQVLLCGLLERVEGMFMKELAREPGGKKG